MAAWKTGDAPVITYTLTDPTTGALTDGTVTATITTPTGTTTTLTPAHPSTGVYRVNPTLTATGEHTYTFTSTSPADSQTVTVYVTASDAAPSWAPTLRDVAAHIPTRTREIGVGNTYAGTFSTETQPTAQQVTTLIAHACVWAAAKAGTPVMPDAYPALTAAAAVRAAYSVELGYPERDADVATYERLLTESETLLAAAVAANRAAGGGTSLDAAGDADVLVRYEFPDPPAWAGLMLA